MGCPPETIEQTYNQIKPKAARTSAATGKTRIKSPRAPQIMRARVLPMPRAVSAGFLLLHLLITDYTIHLKLGVRKLLIYCCLYLYSLLCQQCLYPCG